MQIVKQMTELWNHCFNTHGILFRHYHPDSHLFHRNVWLYLCTSFRFHNADYLLGSMRSFFRRPDLDSQRHRHKYVVIRLETVDHPRNLKIWTPINITISFRRWSLDYWNTYRVVISLSLMTLLVFGLLCKYQQS